MSIDDIRKGLTSNVFRTALLILSGNAAASMLLLMRNLVVARLIPVEDYGVAATFAVVMAMVEMASALGLQQQIVQSKDGDDPRFQAALQGFQVLRGVIAGIVLFVIAGPIARFLGIPEVIWAYQLLALVPVIKAFEHFDIHRLNRQMRFWPMILAGAVPALLSLLMVWPLAVWMGDWRVLLFAILAQMSLFTLISHLVAERPYRLVFDRALMGGSLRFGWPILVNSALMFLIFQGDKMIVGRELGMEALAIFAMGMTLTLTPTLIIAKSAQNFFLPQLSDAVETASFPEISYQTLQMVTRAALIFLVIVFVAGGPVIHILLGDKFASLIPLLIWFAIGQTFRVIRAGPVIVALSVGHTTNAMIANIFRVFFVPLIWIVAVYSSSLLYILLIGAIGEALSVLASFYFLARTSRLEVSKMIVAQIPAVLSIVAIILWAALRPPVEASPGPAVWAVAVFVLSMAVIPMSVIGGIIGQSGKRG